MPPRDHFRLGTGAGFSADRLDPAVDLVAKGRLDAIVFECIGEGTLAFGHCDRMANPEAGYNPLLERRLRAILPLCAAQRTRLITNMGVANPLAAAARAAQVARDLGLRDLRIAAIEGDDVSALIRPDTRLPDSGITVGEVGGPLVRANAYLGADAILPALEAEAEVVITGRVADPSLFLAPLRHAFGWAEDDWPMLGPARWSGISWNVRRRSPAATSRTPGSRTCRTWPMSAFRSPRLPRTGAQRSPSSRTPAA
jgi:Acyclic terpene utilisation family protein AtuA